MNNQQKYKKSKVLNGILGGVLALVIAGGVAAVGVLSNGFKDWNKFKKDDTKQEPFMTPSEEDGGAVINESASNGVSLLSMKIMTADYAEYGVSAAAETAYTLTATVTGTDSLVGSVSQKVDFSAEWSNASSSWASGKRATDYVTVTSTGDNTATISCLQGFSEQIVIKASSSVDSDVYATCTVDYVKRVLDVSVDFDMDTFSNSNNIYSGRGDTPDVKYMTFDITYGEGTIEGEVSYTNYSYIAADGLKEAIIASSYFDIFADYCDDYGYSYDFNLSYTVDLTGGTAVYDILSYRTEYMWVDETVENANELTFPRMYFWYALKEACEANSGDVMWLIDWEYTYNGETLSSGTSESDGYLDVLVDVSYPTVSQVSLDKSGFIF